MGTSDKNHLDIVDIFKSWIPRKTENTNVSKDFWMPDQSCRVCYECDSQFTVFNRKHHCRLCGRVFCAKCTSHSIPAPCEESKTDGEECEKIRVCNFCFNQWQQGILIVSDSAGPSSPVLSPSPSTSSLGSINSGYNDNSNCSNAAASIAHSSGSYDHVSYGSCMSSQVFSQASPCRTGHRPSEQSSSNTVADAGGPSSHECSFSMSSDDEDKDVCAYQSDSDVRHLSESVEYNGSVRYDEINHPYQIYTSQHVEDGSDGKAVSPLSAEICTTQVMEGSLATSGEESYGHGTHGGCEASLYGIESTDFDKLDFENDVLLWLPPETEEEEDENEAIFFDDDEDGNASGEWGYPCSSCSSNAGDVRHRDKSNEEHRKAMRNVVSGHFRALIAQLLQIENLPVHERDNKESWLDIITTLSWEAAAFLKPDMSESGGMDPGGYVKVKCLASGQRSESKLIKGVACKKNVAHRRMISKFDRPRLLILAGALEYQRVSNQLSSFNTLLKQEMDHLKMAVTKIHAHHPNILLVEKSVSRFAQDYLLEKGISVVLNIKRPLLERIARCTGALIVPSVDHVSSQKLGYCDSFHVEKYFEQHGSAGQGGKKLMKTLMFLEGCPKPLGCTILLKGAHGDELKKVKHVLQYGVFAAYNLALETSFLADEGASLPELPLKSPITVALPDKASNISKAISTIPGFSVPAAGSGRALIDQLACDTQKSSDSLIFDLASPSKSDPIPSLEEVISCTQTCRAETSPDLIYSDGHSCVGQLDTCTTSSCLMTSKDGVQGVSCRPADFRVQKETEQFNPQSASSKQRMNDQNEELPSSKEIFPPSPSDNQSILVSLMTRCVWKGVVCERAHLFRIKYYGSFDRPLGRFLQDHLFDQSYRCKSCEMPSEAHIHCYTHKEGSLTISVRKLSDLFSAEGKIWMWHRCLRCPRSNGFPPTTQRVVMSDAAWGLSFGKFLELSFSNHAATSRIACCGHSLHRDCLRFYGSGRMVACFRYAPIDVHSVCLPPAKLEFNYNKQDWIQKELNEVGDRAELLFTDVCNALNRISVEVPDIGSLEGSLIAYGLRKHIAELEKRLRKEKEEFEGLLQIVLNKEAEAGQPAIDILEINKLRRRLLFQSYVWDQRLVYAASLTESMPMHGMNSVLKSAEKSLNIVQGIETDGSSQHVKGSSSCRLNVSDGQPDTDLDFEGDLSRTNQPSACREELHSSHQINTNEDCEDVSPEISKLDPLESCYPVQRDLSDGQFLCMVNLSETLDAAWTGQFLLGNAASKENDEDLPIHVPKDSSNCATPGAATSILENYTIDNRKEVEMPHPLGLALPTRGSGNTEYSTSWLGMPFINLYCLLNTTDSPNTHTLDAVLEYKPVYLSSFCELKRHGGARLLLPIGINDTVVPVYDDEPTSIISYTLVSPDYHTQMSNSSEMTRDGLESSISLPNLDSSGDTTMESLNTQGSLDEKLLSAQGSWSNLVLDPFLYTKASHLKVSFVDDDPNGKVKYKVICYYSKRFEALRKMCCPSELDYIRSLSRCKKWGAQGGKSNVFFAKTLDDRFIIKQVTKTELESFIKFAPTYFKYLSESISTGSPTCLAKILGIYQVTSKHFNTGRESKMDVLVMENLLFQRNVTRLYDLKGSARSRYNPDSTGGNKVLLDQNLIETMPTSPIFVGNKAKRLLERAVWNDTPFLSSVDVMDYSLLVGLDDEKHELVLGIIDYMRQYTWDKHLESWVKATGILGGPKNASPTVISPGQYKKRFRKAMSTYFLVAPDHWCPLPPTAKSASQSDHQ